jgi:hypothetical protein
MVRRNCSLRWPFVGRPEPTFLRINSPGRYCPKPRLSAIGEREGVQKGQTAAEKVNLLSAICDLLFHSSLRRE